MHTYRTVPARSPVKASPTAPRRHRWLESDKRGAAGAPDQRRALQGVGRLRRPGLPSPWRSAPQVQAAARERLAAESAARFGIRISSTAAEALQDALECENGIVGYLWERIGTDNPTELLGETSTRAMYGLYEQAQVRRTKIAGDMARLKIEERRQHIFERDIDAIAAAWSGLLAAFTRAWNLSAQQVAEGRALIAEQLEALGGGTS